MGTDESNNNVVSDNRITVSGDAKYNYGIRFGNNVDGTIINNNTIDVTGTVYACGVEVGKSDESQVLYNNISLAADNFTYGVFLSTNDMGQVNDATIFANIINITAKDNYGIELYGPDTTTISENVIYATGDYSLGIAGYNSDENTITDNNITVIGDSSKDKQLTADKITQDIVGVALLARSSAKDNTIATNNITVIDLAGNDAYAVTIKGKDNTVSNNTLIGTNLCGNLAVNATADNTVENNLPKSVQVSMDEVTGFIGQATTITATVVYDDGENVQEGTVTFKDGDKVLGTADVVDGVASIEVTYTKALNKTITAEFANDDATATAENTLTVRKAGTTITIDEFNATIGEEVTITATVLDEEGNAVTNGKVVFKINGKTLKDANGKVIYAKVVDGVATITYNVTEDWTDANISAVYSGSSKYEESNVSNVAINMTETTPVLTIEPITDSVTIGTQVTLKATVTGTPTPLNTGKIVFKLNGKTLKDDSGKVIYAKIVDGEVVLNYTFKDIKAKTYTLSAVLVGSDYDRLEDSTNVTFVE